MTPVALFTYNRSQELQRTLDCLKNNKIDFLYIFSDGPKNEEDKQKIRNVRKILDQIDWVKTEKFYQEKNIGLFDSVISGVNKVFEKYDTIICIEDDICVVNGFYEYMKVCLDKYMDDPKIAGVTGLRYPFSREVFKTYPYDVFFTSRVSSWGWGTWRRSWQTVDFNQQSVTKKIQSVKLDTRPSGADMSGMVEALIDGSLHESWAVYYCVNMLLNKQYFVWPTWNMVENTGFTEGTHASAELPSWQLHWESERCPKLDELRVPNRIVCQEKIQEAFLSFFNSIHSSKKSIRTKVLNTVKQIILKGFNTLGYEIKRKRKSFKHEVKPNPADYSAMVGEGSVVPCQIEAYFLALNKYVDESATVLDVGFGLGYGLNILAIKAKKVSGVDVDQKVYDYCQGTIVGRNPRVVHLSIYDGYSLNFPNNHFDVVTCVDVIEYVEDYEKLIEEMLRVSKNGVFLSTPNRRPEYTNPDGTPKNYWHLREWSFEEFDEIIRKYGKIDWDFLNGPFEGPFTCSKTVQENTLTLSPFIFKDIYGQ